MGGLFALSVEVYVLKVVSEPNLFFCIHYILQGTYKKAYFFKAGSHNLLSHLYYMCTIIISYICTIICSYILLSIKWTYLMDL